MTYADGENSVTVAGCSNITLRFGSTADLETDGAFDAETSRKIFEDKNEGMLA
jgi:hypothetical protein